jgi:hypothetical protein
MIFYSTSAGSKRISGICSCFFAGVFLEVFGTRWDIKTATVLECVLQKYRTGLWNKTCQDIIFCRDNIAIGQARLRKGFQNEVEHQNSDGTGMCFAKIPDRFMEQNSGKFFAYVVGNGNTYVRSSELMLCF